MASPLQILFCGGSTGTWRIDPKGAYCVNIDWPGTVENWCRRLYKVGDKYYAVKATAEDDTAAHELTIKK